MAIHKKDPRNRSAATRKRELYKKSRYYQESRQKLYIAGGIGAFILVFILILPGIRRCSNYRNSKAAENAAAQDAVSMNVSSETSSEAADAVVVDPVSLTLSVVGDCTLGTDETFDYDTSLNAYYESYGADYFFQNVRSIFQKDDLSIVNMEGTLTDETAREAKTFAFKAPAKYAAILSGSSIEAANLANNHSHDYGKKSYTDTISALDDAGIASFGYNRVKIFKVKGIKVGVTGIYELADHQKRASQVKKNIKALKKAGAQIIIVNFHLVIEKQ